MGRFGSLIMPSITAADGRWRHHWPRCFGARRATSLRAPTCWCRCRCTGLGTMREASTRPPIWRSTLANRWPTRCAGRSAPRRKSRCRRPAAMPTFAQPSRCGHSGGAQPATVATCWRGHRSRSSTTSARLGQRCRLADRCSSRREPDASGRSCWRKSGRDRLDDRRGDHGLGLLAVDGHPAVVGRQPQVALADLAEQG